MGRTAGRAVDWETETGAVAAGVEDAEGLEEGMGLTWSERLADWACKKHQGHNR
jgi:hypothetical protein